MLPKMNETEQRVFEALRDFHNINGFMPSTRELAPLVGLVFSGIPEYLKRLEDRGYIQRFEGVSPRIRILRSE